VELRYPANRRYRVITGDMSDPDAPWRHHADKLAEQVIAFYRSQRADVRESAPNQDRD
jgi:hypothetical protein